jgi:hypothetical protein
MDTTEIIETPIAEPGLVLGAEAKYFLHTAGRWASFLGILGFIGTGFIVLCAFFVTTIFSLMSRLNPAASAMPSGFGGIFTFYFLAIAVFYFFMSYYMYQFGVNAKNCIAYNDTAMATKALKNLKSHLKLVGITAIVIISIYAVFIVIGIIVAVAAGSR